MRRRVARGAALLLATTTCSAAATGGVSPPSVAAAWLGTIGVSVDLEPDPAGPSLGSYGAVLTWDPTVLEYAADSGGGDAPFDTAVVNRTDVAFGALSFADAAPSGASGTVTLITVAFRVVAGSPASSVLDLEFSSAFGSGTFEDLLPSLVATDGLVTIVLDDFDLRPVDAAGTLWEWDAVAGALSYDLLRGSVLGLHDDGTYSRLGVVACIEDDSLDTTTAGGVEPPAPDLALPAVGQAFFYLVRFDGGGGPQPLGFGSPAMHERLPDSGGCP